MWLNHLTTESLRWKVLLRCIGVASISVARTFSAVGGSLLVGLLLKEISYGYVQNLCG